MALSGIPPLKLTEGLVGGESGTASEAREATRGSEVDISEITECSQLTVEQMCKDGF